MHINFPFNEITGLKVMFGRNYNEALSEKSCCIMYQDHSFVSKD